ncbi:hypothetical protein [Nannocystis pusilla]|uniref:hypothetical protein n=1 Tax=Nannocystis pusilla TaxID=889268 RepID=UPI003B7909A2
MNSILDPALLDPALQALRTQLEAAAAAFAGDSAHLGALLRDDRRCPARHRGARRGVPGQAPLAGVGAAHAAPAASARRR